jgi:uncharacterized membrane protein YphA (DoxX/SURF4 family)
MDSQDGQGLQEAKVSGAELQADPVVQWSTAKRATFRFCFVYFTLYCLSNQIFSGLFPIPKLNIPDFGALWPLRQITFWTAAHVFHVTHPLVYTGSGSGDKTFDWVQTFFLLVLALVAAAVWSLLDRRRPNYVALYKWFRAVIRFALASEMFLYGFDKVIPLQMPFPFLTRLVEPFGNFSPMGVLWYSIGASRSAEICTGCAEVLGGLLLLAPRTTTFGAMVCFADTALVFILNMTYDVPVKLFSFHLILFSIFLLAPDLPRLCNFFFSSRETPPPQHPPLFRRSRANRIAVAVQLIFGLYLIGMNIYGGVTAWYQYGGGRPKPELYGIWSVEEMSIDGQIRAPLLNDYDRWRRVLFDFTTTTSFQRMDDTVTGYPSSIDAKDKTITLTKAANKNWKTIFNYDRPAEDQLKLDGTMDGHKIQMRLKLVDRSKLMLVSRGFHWINEYPFQR